jgi:signal transduction histidine kinase
MSSSGSSAPVPSGGAAPHGAALWSALAQPWWQRITFRLTILVLAVSTLPPLTLGVLAMRSARVAQEREIREQNTAVAHWGVDKVQSYLDNVQENMRLMAELGELQTMDPHAAKAPISYFLSFMEDVKEVSLIDARGQELLRLAEHTLVTASDLTNQAKSPKFQIPISGEAYIGPVRVSEFSEPFVTVALPIRSLAEDKVVGVLAVEVNLKHLWDDVLSFKVGQSGYLYLVNGTGQLLAHPDFSLVLARKDLSGMGAVRRFLAKEEEENPAKSLEYSNYQEVPVVGVHARSPKLGWGVIVEQSTAEAFAGVDRMKIETTVILINAVIVTMVLSTLAARQLTRPLAELAQGARILGAGNFGHRIPLRARKDEFDEVAQRFNAMADQLRDSFQRLRTILETSAMTSSSLEPEKVLTTALEQMDLLTGRAQSGILLLEGRLDSPPVVATVRTLETTGGTRPLSIEPQDYPYIWQALSETKTVSVEHVQAEVQTGERALWAAQGLGAVVLIPLLSKGQVLGILWMGRADSGPFTSEEVALGQTVANHIAIAIDNARLYEALRRATEDLVRTERLALLGQLAGGVGHELRNPLGAIGNAVYYLRMRLGADDPKVQKHLGILDREIRRANKIVTDLLDYSRVKPPSRTAANLNAVIQDVLGRQPEEPTVKRELDLVEPLPAVLVDADQVGQVLLNLVVNATEAMPDGGTLTIRTRATGPAVIASFIDTGIGIPPENLEKIFQPLFTTKTKGIGLGLAVSRRLIEANGGTLTVESRNGDGSTFTVTIPVPDSGGPEHA